MTEILDRMSTKRLLAYSAAAGMGAFALGQEAQAAVQENLSLSGTTFAHSGIASNGDDFTVDININEFVTGTTGHVPTGDTTNDVRLGVFLNAIGMTGFPGNAVLANSTSGAASYYVTGFQNGSTVSGANDAAGGGINLAFVTPYVSLYGGTVTYRYQLFHTANGDWIGVQFDIAGSTHFGAIQIREFAGVGPLDGNGSGSPNDSPLDISLDPVRVTLGAIIWEDQANTPLVIPEPASLGLLAMGAGAIGLRRRRSA